MYRKVYLEFRGSMILWIDEGIDISEVLTEGELNFEVENSLATAEAVILEEMTDIRDVK